MSPDMERINAAVRACISECVPSSNPSVAILIYLKSLRAKGWSEGEVAIVRQTVTHFLRQLAGQVESADNPQD